MNLPKCADDDYINFLIAAPRHVSATEAAKVQGDEEQAPAHDAFTRLLHRLKMIKRQMYGRAKLHLLRAGMLYAN